MKENARWDMTKKERNFLLKNLRKGSQIIDDDK